MILCTIWVLASYGYLFQVDLHGKLLNTTSKYYTADFYSSVHNLKLRGLDVHLDDRYRKLNVPKTKCELVD